MADILPFKKISTKQKHRGNSLCREGHHRWRVVSEKKFDVKQGRLVTEFVCQRCAKTRIALL